jgi:putative Mg2+ transporter-C (MgtC) family protein
MTIVDVLFRLAAASAAGGAVGLERQIHGRPAGLRTHVLVCTGACIAVASGMMAAEVYPDLDMDTGRIASGVITGVGFLGAGTIVHYREGVGGLTTAACIWFVAMTGMLAGFGFYLFTALATAVAVSVLLFLDRLEDKMPSASYWRLRVRFSGRDFASSEDECRSILSNSGMLVKGSTVSVSDDSTEFVFVLKTRYRKRHTKLIEKLNGLDGIKSVKWAHRTEEL